MKKIIISCSIVLSIVSLIVLCIQRINNNSTLKDKITTISFPQPGGDIPNNVDFSLDENVITSVEKNNPNITTQIDKAIKYATITDSTDKLTKLKKAFNIDRNAQTVRDDKDKSSLTEDSSKYIRFHDDGTFDYHIKERDTSNNNTIADNDTIKISEKFLKENNLLPNDFYFTTVGYEKVTSVNNSSNSKIMRKFVYFNRKINGVTTSGISRIVVGVGQNGQIDDVYYSAKPLSDFRNVKIKDFNTAYTDLKKLDNGMFNIQSDTKSVKIHNVELAYWDDCSPNSNQNYIQPVYKFTGDEYNEAGVKSEFTGIISAISDDLTVKDKSVSPIFESTPKLPKSNN